MSASDHRIAPGAPDSTGDGLPVEARLVTPSVGEAVAGTGEATGRPEQDAEGAPGVPAFPIRAGQGERDFGAELAEFMRRRVEICPNCKTEIGHGSCCMTYTTWHCWGCGANLDSRVVTPLTVLRCENEWPDYKPSFADPKHPIACACTGRGWFEYEEVFDAG